jgi:neurofibromin 1
LLSAKALAEAFLGLICDTAAYVPQAIRQLCHHIHLVVSSKFPDSVYTAIGGWIFLRYINPSIISPDIVDVEVPGESKEVRRALLLVTKVGLYITKDDAGRAFKQPL